MYYVYNMYVSGELYGNITCKWEQKGSKRASEWQ